MAKVMMFLASLLPIACMAARLKVDTNVDEASNSSAVPPSFYFNLAKFGQGYQKAFCHDSTNCANITDFPSPDSYVEMEAAKVAEQLAKVPARQRAGEIVRGNDLGFFILNRYLWIKDGEYQTIGLGVSVKSHEYIRPIFDKIFHPSQNNWKIESIAQQSKEFIESQQTFDTNGGLSPFLCKLMHKVHLDLDLTDTDAKEFVDFQTAVLPRIIVPGAVGPGAELVATREKFLMKYMDQMAKDDRGVFPADMKGREPGGKMYLVAAGLMDSMLFAGGLSVEGLTKTALNVLYSKDYDFLGDGATDYHGFDRPGLDGDDVEAFVYEVARLFPAVVGFSWWAPEKNGRAYNANKGGNTYTHRTVMNLAMSLRDPRVWGPGYKQFRPQKVAFYEQNLGNAWALSANEAGTGPGDLGNMSRGCPGKQLSISIVTSFVREWIKQKDTWAVGPGTEDGIKLADHTPFVSGTFVNFGRILARGSLDTRVENENPDAKVKMYFELVATKQGKVLQGRIVNKSVAGCKENLWGVAQCIDYSRDLSKVTGLKARSEYHFEDYSDPGGSGLCFKMTNTVPWGPFKGSSWETNQIFCAEILAEKNAWYDALKGSPFAAP